MSEENYWKSTPAKIYELAMIHSKVNSNDEKPTNDTPGMVWYEVLD